MIHNAVALLLGLFIGIRVSEYWDFKNELIAFQKTVKVNPKPEDPAVITFNKTKVLCLVLENPMDFGTEKTNVRFSWGRHCNKLIFLGNKDNNTFASVRRGLTHAFKKYINDFDWFLRADTNTFVIMENLRGLLNAFNPESPLYFGHRLKSDFPEGFMSADAGYVLSKAALRQLKEKHFCDSDLNSSVISEDKQMGRCLSLVGAIAGESRDSLGQERFLPLKPYWIRSGLQRWKNYIKSAYFKPTSRACCSSSLISFHPANGNAFDLWEFFLHRIRLFGRPQSPPKLSPRLSDQEMHAQLRIWSGVVSDNPA